MRQDQQYKETVPTNPVDIVPYDKYPSEGQGLTGPFKVPSDVLKKQYFYGKCTSQLIVDPPTTRKINEQKMNFSNSEKNNKEKRKPTVSKNTKPKQQVPGFCERYNNLKLEKQKLF